MESKAREMLEIPLSNSDKLSLVDDSDYPWLIQSRWRITPEGYASKYANINGIETYVLMHRLILDTPKGLLTDHINRNRLDNQRSNLRICTNGQNVMNSSQWRKSATGIKGVRFHKQMQRYTAHIAINKTEIYLGMFSTLEEARARYIQASLALHGEFSSYYQHPVH